MIHETLFYLWHNPEYLENAEVSNLFELQDFLHQSEKYLLSRIIETMVKYYKITGFINSIKDQRFDEKDGLYIRAFANGLHTVMEPYRKHILELENKYLQNPQLPLTYILGSIESYRIFFDDLQSMVELIQNDKLKGCLLIGSLLKYVHYGSGMTSHAAGLIVKNVNTLFYSHLCNWIIYGEIGDIYDEFFIRDEKCPDRDFLYSEQISDDSLNAATSIGTDLFKRSRVQHHPIVKKFSINWNMVPIFVNKDAAERILFMGRIVWIVMNGPKKRSKRSEDNYEKEYRRDIWEGNALDYYRKIQNLGTQSFCDFEFRLIIEECRLKLTKYLWSLMLDEGNVKEHLQLIRDYYALGRGELFQQFMTAAEAQLKDSPSDYVLQNLNIIFLESANNLYGDHDRSYHRFELISSKVNTSSNPWARLKMNFEIKWPLHIVFHPKAMELYNKFFSYLLCLKKTQMNLQKLWQFQVCSKLKVDRRVWTLRHNLMFLVNNLQYYLQVDVIEAHFSVLMKAVENANEFEDIIKVHHEFVTNLLSKTFIFNADEEETYENKHRLFHKPAVQFDATSKVYTIIMKILKLSDEFSLIATTWGEELYEPEILELDGFQKTADLLIESLLFILYNLREKTNGQHIFQLLNQLNFNKFYSKTKPNFNLSLL